MPQVGDLAFAAETSNIDLFSPETARLTGEAEQEDIGLGRELLRGGRQGAQNLKSGFVATAAEFGSEKAAFAQSRMDAVQQQSHEFDPAPGMLNKAVNIMGQGVVEQAPNFAAMAAGALLTGGAANAAVAAGHLGRARAIASAGRTAGLATSVIGQGFGRRKQDLIAKGIGSESAANFWAMASSLGEAGLELMGPEAMVARYMDDMVLGTAKQAAKIAGSEAKVSMLKKAMRIPSSYGKRVAWNVSMENLEEQASLMMNGVIDKATTGKFTVTGGDVLETMYQTTLKTAIPALIGAGFSGGRADVRRSETQASIHAPVSEQTLQQAYTTTANVNATAEEAQTETAAQIATMDAHMEALEQILTKRFTPVEAQANSTLIRTMAENLAAMNPNKTPVDYVADVRLAFEQGQIDQEAWDVANTIEDPTARLREKDRLMREIPGFGEQYYDTTEQAIANQIRNDNDAREQDTFNQNTEQAQAAQLKDSVKAPAGQDTFVVPAATAVSQQQYDSLYKRGRVRGVVVDGQTYTVMSRGKVANPSGGGYHVVQPGSLLFTKSDEAIPAVDYKGPANTIDEDVRSNMLDFADSADVTKAWAASPQTDTTLGYALSEEEVAEAAAEVEAAELAVREDLQAALELQLEQMESSVDEAGITVADLEDLAVLDEMQAEDIATVRAKITAAEPTPSTEQIDKFLARKEAAAKLAPPTPTPVAPTTTAAPIKSFNSLADEISRREKAAAAGKDTQLPMFSQDQSTPHAYYDTQGKAMHFLHNATADDVVHEWFHHMTETTGLMPTALRDSLINQFSIEGQWDNQTAETAVNSMLLYFRNKELPEGAPPKLEKAFTYMQRILAASAQANAGIWNDDTLATFDQMFGFKVTPEESFIGNALNDRMEHAKGFETDEPEARWVGPVREDGRFSEAPQLDPSQQIYASDAEGAGRIEAMSKAEQDEVEFSTPGYQLFEARKKLPKKVNHPKFKRLTDSNSDALWFDYEYLANVEGTPYGLTLEEDPDDSQGKVWVFQKIGARESVDTFVTKAESDSMDQVMALMQEHHRQGTEQESGRFSERLSLAGATRLDPVQQDADLSAISAKLSEEIQARVEAGGLTEQQAFDDISSAMDEQGNPASSFRTEVRDLMIEQGLATEVSDQQRKDAVGKGYDFKRGGRFYTYGAPATGRFSETVVRASVAEANAAAATQRSEPEAAMIDVQRNKLPAIGVRGGVLNYYLEHGGDLSNRLQSDTGAAGFKSKIESMKLDVGSIQGQIESQLDAAGVSREQVLEALSSYRSAHAERNQPVTYWGALGKKMAVAVGELDYGTMESVVAELTAYDDASQAAGTPAEAEALRLAKTNPLTTTGRFSETGASLTDEQRSKLRSSISNSAVRTVGKTNRAAFIQKTAKGLFPDLVTTDEHTLSLLDDAQLNELLAVVSGSAAHSINSSMEKEAWWMFGRNSDGSQRPEFVNFQSLTPEQQAEVRNKTMAGWQQVKESDKLEKNPELLKNKKLLDEHAKQTASDISDEIDERPTGGAGAPPEAGTSGRFGLLADEAKLMYHAVQRFRHGLWNRVMVQTKGPLDLTAIMADGNKNSAIHKVGGMITEAGKRFVLQQRKTQKFLDGLMEKHKLASWPRTLGRPIKLAGRVMRREHALAIAMYTRNDLAQDDTGSFINKQAEALYLSNGRSLVGASKDGIVSREQFIELANASWAYVQGDAAALGTMKTMDDYFVTAAKEIDATRVLLGEEPIGKVKGYFPLARKGGMLGEEDLMGLAMGITPTKSMQNMSTAARQKARTSEFGQDIVLDALRVFENYVKQADIFVAKEPLVRTARASVNGAMTSFKEKSLEAEAQMLIDLIETERHANGRSTVMSPQEHLIQVVSGAYKRSLIGANAPVVFRQAISMPTAMGLLPVSSSWMMGSSFLKLHGYAVSNMRKGSPNVLDGNATWEMMKAGGSPHTSSEYITTEATGREGASGAQTGITIGGVKLVDIPLLPIRYMDMVTRTAVWGTAYESRKAELMNEKTMTEAEIHDDAFAYADDITRQSQPPANLSDRAQIQKGNEYLKGLVPFTGQLFKNWNLFNRHIRRPAERAWKGGFERGGSISALQDVMGVIMGTQASKQAYGGESGAGKVFAYTFVVPALALSTLARGRPPEDFEEFMGDLFAYNIAMIPVIGPIISAKLLYDKARADASPLYANMLEDIVDLVTATDGEDMTDQLFRTLSRGTGIPGSFQRMITEGFEGQYGKLDAIDWEAFWKDGVMNFK